MIEGHAEIGVTAAIVAVAVPAMVFSVTLFALRTYLVREVDALLTGLVAGCVAILVGGDRARRCGCADRPVPGGRDGRARGRRGRLRDVGYRREAAAVERALAYERSARTANARTTCANATPAADTNGAATTISAMTLGRNVNPSGPPT